MNKEDISKELLAKKQLSNEEFEELIKLSPPGSFKKPPYNLLDLGIKDLKVAMDNLTNLAILSEKDYQNGCYLEVLSLRLLFWIYI